MKASSSQYITRGSSRKVLVWAISLAVGGVFSAGPTAAEDINTGTRNFIQLAPYSSVQDIANARGSLERGRHLFSYWCASCHAAGHEHPGTEALNHKYGEKEPPELDRRKDLTPNLVKYYVRTGVSDMPFFRKAEISDADLNDIATYLSRNVPPPAK